MKKLSWYTNLAVLALLCTITACPARKIRQGIQGSKKEAKQAAAQKIAPSPAKSESAAGSPAELGLELTKDGIRFLDSACAGAFTSNVTDVVTNEANRRTAYKITSTCTSNGNSYIWEYSDILYNPLGQKIAYTLKLSSSKQNKTYNIKVSDIFLDNYWEPISYKAVIDGAVYTFKR